MNLKLTRPVRVPKAVCPSCSTPVDGATGVSGARLPESGDISICAYCFEVAQYDHLLQLAPCDVTTLQPEDRATVEQARMYLRLARGS